MSPVRRFAAGALAAAVVILATALPASAHDQLIQSTPGVDERLTAPPESVTLTFSGELLMLGDSSTGALVLLVDADGKNWVSGDPVVNGNTVTAAVAESMPDAGYQVRWQVVSEDGHPISGVVPFTVGDASPMATAKTDAATTDAPADDAAQTADEADGMQRTLLVGAGGAAIAAAAFLLYRFLRRPRAAAAAPESGDSADTQP